MKNETADLCYDEAMRWEGGRPSGLLIRAADEIYKLQQALEKTREASLQLMKEMAKDYS